MPTDGRQMCDLRVAQESTGYGGAMTEPSQHEVDQVEEDIEDVKDDVDTGEPQDGDERTFIDPDGDGEPDPHLAEPSGL